MTVRVTISDYIDKLTEQQSQAPLAQRKHVPTYADLAHAIGVKRQTVHAFVTREKHARLDLDLLDLIIKQFRAYGYDTQISDLLLFEDN